MKDIEYLALMFNKRTYGKKYENYIVNAIYTKVNNEELEPVTQQYVNRGNGKYALLDLYFPQINYGIEIDEPPHESSKHKKEDEKRAVDIRNAIQCEEGRISIYNTKTKSNFSIKEINEQIQNQVKIINNLIAKYEKINKHPLKWLSNDEKKQEINKLGNLSIEDDVTFSSFVDVYNFIQGENKIKGTYHCGRKLNSEYFLWVPQLTIIQDDGKTNALGGWKNFLSDNREEVREAVPPELRKETKVGPWDEGSKKRVIFMKMKDRFGKPCTKFIGVFMATEIIQDKKDKIRIYKRIDTKIKLKDLR